jgi:glycosyltransferase involved in cell wall biosynthesis
MRITCMIDHLVSGGAQRQLCTLAVFLKRQGHDVTVVTYRHEDFYLPMLQEAGVSYYCVQRQSKLGRILALRRLLRKGGQDVVLAFLDGPCFYAELAALPWRRWGLVVSERLAIPSSHRARLPWRRWLHRVADYVVTNSHTNRLMIEHSVPRLAGRVVTIYNALDLDRFSPGPRPGPRNPAGLRLVVAARHAHQKNGPGLAEALALVRAQDPGLTVTVDWYGYDPYAGQRLPEPTPLEATLELLRRHGLEDRFRIHPDAQNIADIYREADAVMLPSFFEGLPNTLCEAMGCGRPVLASNVCDAGNLVHEGVNGFLFDPHSPADTAAAILKLAALGPEERDALGARGRKMAEEMFDPARVLGKYEEVLEAAAARRRGGIGHWVPAVPASAHRALG